MQTPAPRALALRTTGVTYPGSAERVRAVRADLRPLIRDCPMVDEVILCASEFAANAAIHSDSRLPGGTFTVRAKLSPGDYVWIEVEDDGGLWAPVVSDPTGPTDSTSSATWPATGESKAITPAAPSGHRARGPGPSSRRSSLEPEQDHGQERFASHVMPSGHS